MPCRQAAGMSEQGSTRFFHPVYVEADICVSEIVEQAVTRFLPRLAGKRIAFLQCLGEKVGIGIVIGDGFWIKPSPQLSARDLAQLEMAPDIAEWMQFARKFDQRHCLRGDPRRTHVFGGAIKLDYPLDRRRKLFFLAHGSIPCRYSITAGSQSRRLFRMCGSIVSQMRDGTVLRLKSFRVPHSQSASSLTRSTGCCCFGFASAKMPLVEAPGCVTARSKVSSSTSPRPCQREDWLGD